MTDYPNRSSLAERISGSAMIAAVLVSLVMIMHHPVVSHHDTQSLVRGIREQAGLDRLVHGMLPLSSGVLTCGALLFSARLGLANRLHVLIGALAVLLSLVFTCLAVMLDGFVAPALAERCGQGSACFGSVSDLLLIGALQIEFLTRSAIFATALATALWAADLMFRQDGSKAVGAIGALSSAAQIWLLLGTANRLTPHELAIVVLAQSAWYVGMGAMMAFGRGSNGAETGGLAVHS